VIPASRPSLHVFMPYGPAGASARVRVYNWLDHLGVDTDSLHPYLGRSKADPATILRHPLAALRAETDLRLLIRHELRGTVLVHREASPLSTGAVESRLFAAADRSLYDFDDALQWDWGEMGGLRALVPKAPKAIRLVQEADMVVAANQMLADWASRWAREVVCIPSCVDPNRYQAKDFHALHDPPRLGWIGSSASERYLQLIAAPLLHVHRRTGARLSVLSSGDASLGPLDAIVDRIDWSEARAQFIASGWDIGLMPVPEGLYERGKSGYKLLEYGASKLPAVGSPVGVNDEILRAFGCPRPQSPSEWVEALLDLLHASDERRHEVGEQERKAVEEGYSYSAWGPTWAAVVGIPRSATKGSDN